MKKILLSTFACSLFFIIFSCRHEPAEIPANRQVDLDDAVLGRQECVDFTEHGLTVCFVDAYEWRCQCDVICVWEGAVNFSLKVKGADIDTLVTLTTNSAPKGTLNDSLQVGGRVLRIRDNTDLTCENYGNYEKYKVKVSIEE